MKQVRVPSAVLAALEDQRAAAGLRDYQATLLHAWGPNLLSDLRRGRVVAPDLGVADQWLHLGDEATERLALLRTAADEGGLQRTIGQLLWLWLGEHERGGGR